MDPKRISDTEFAVMQVVWSHDGPVTFSQIRKALNGSDWAAATIRTMVRRLCSKGVLIQHEQEGDLYVFEPAVTRDEYKLAQTNDLIGRVYGGDIKALKAALADYEVDEGRLNELKEKWRRGRKDA